MRAVKKIMPPLAAVLCFTLAGCSKPADSDDSPPLAKPRPATSGVMLDQAAQARLGLKMALPVTTRWQPEIKAYGVVIDPSALTAALADLGAARATAEVSEKESARQKGLAAQNNASARVVETAQAAALHDQLMFAATWQKFKAEWGTALATNNDDILSQLTDNHMALVRVDLPAGTDISLPNNARLVMSTDETMVAEAEFYDRPAGIDPQTQSQRVFLLAKKALPPNAAVTALLKTSDITVAGVIIPADAVLRYEGKGWIYEQTGTNRFLRVEVPLDCPVPDGWFVSGEQPITNGMVISGAGTILSAELSGSFDANNRD